MPQSNGQTAPTQWDPEATEFPSRKNLPPIPGAPPEAAWFWGPNDSLGRLNLLTTKRIKAAVRLIETGELIPLDLPLDTPAVPSFGREPFQHSIKEVQAGIVYDDLYTLNTQSGSQWDGFGHFAHLASKTFYNGATSADILASSSSKCSIHHWATHGIAGRGILLDYHRYASQTNRTYDPFRHLAITLSDLAACGRAQGIDIRPGSAGGDIKIGDILFVRSGFVERYYASSPAEREQDAARPSHESAWAGVAQEEDMLNWLHDAYFAAVVGDAPTFEAWPSCKEYHLHEYLLALWGVPIGEMWDLERLARVCVQERRWVFFVNSAPAN
ncbi:hypothetical protein FE257_003745 [Aspergillus nanangensis]|uniref:Uncharacterized protein n=1 Tax=Aspergillus nanangensis TaxID=2582783 RepID=A0AAD4CBP0_ASPNN|nr:hypothetical protein FE257_003745 [Aspergillus nanangensis]